MHLASSSKLTSNNSYSILLTLATIALSTLILSIILLHNGFPLLLPDSNGYINRAFHFVESSHWSNTYSVYLAFFIHFFHSLGFAAIIQNLSIVSVLYLFSKHFIPKFSNMRFLIVISCLAATTLPWISVMLMSDIFTSIALLAVTLVLVAKLSRAEKLVISILLFISISAHQSHIIIVPAYLGFVFLCQIVFRKFYSIKNLTNKVVFVFVLYFASLAFEKTIFNRNVLGVVPDKIEASNKPVNSEKGAKDVSSGYYFIAVRIYESGQLGKLLNGFCADGKDNYLCDRDTLHSPIFIKSSKAISRNEDNESYIMYSNDNRELVRYAIWRPSFYRGMIKLVGKRGFELLESLDIRNFNNYPDKPHLVRRFKEKMNNISSGLGDKYMASKQLSGAYVNINKDLFESLNFGWFNIVLPILIIIILISSVVKRKFAFSKHLLFICLILLAAHVLNTLVCGTFSNMGNVRYSARTVWFLNLCIVILMFNLFDFITQRKTE